MTTQTNQKQAIIDYLTSLGIEYSAELIPRQQVGEKYPRTYWRIRLSRKHHTMECEYSQGKAYRDDPSLIDVLYCLVSDADVFNYSSFEEWADSFGYDTDSRKAEEIYRICLKQTHDLFPIIGGPEGLKKLQELYQDY